MTLRKIKRTFGEVKKESRETEKEGTEVGWQRAVAVGEWAEAVKQQEAGKVAWT